jgi:DNA-binding NarL/FixJ family response regulator
LDTTGAIRILVIDDHPVVHQGLDLVIEEADDLIVCGHARNGDEGVRLAARTRPHVCMVETRMPGDAGMATLARLREKAPSVGLIVYSAYGDRSLLSDALELGALGYVLKSAPVQDVLRAVHTVADGRAYVDPTLSAALLAGSPGAQETIGSREREVLRLLATGLRMQEVADRMGLTREQAKADARRATSRLGASGRVHAVAIALRRDLIDWAR